MITIFTDGGSRGNPGPAAFGVVIRTEKELLAEIGQTIGIATNNVAEYTAVLAALQWLAAHPEQVKRHEKIAFFMDSLLVVSQLTGVYKIKSTTLHSILLKIHAVARQLGVPISYTHVPRAQNKEADRLVNMALDNTLPVS